MLPVSYAWKDDLVDVLNNITECFRLCDGIRIAIREKGEYFEELQLGAGVLCDWVEQWRGQGMSLDSCSSCISIPP